MGWTRFCSGALVGVIPRPLAPQANTQCRNPHGSAILALASNQLQVKSRNSGPQEATGTTSSSEGPGTVKSIWRFQTGRGRDCAILTRRGGNSTDGLPAPRVFSRSPCEVWPSGVLAQRVLDRLLHFHRATLGPDPGKIARVYGPTECLDGVLEVRLLRRWDRVLDHR